MQRVQHLPRQRRQRLLEFARSLPQQERTGPVPPTPSYQHHQPNMGAMIVRMLANRNLAWPESTKLLFLLTDGRLYLSASTIGAIGHGRKELTPELVAGLAAVLGIPAGDLAALVR